MTRPWPSGPDGQPLTADEAGEPEWPSEQYRRDYERALADRSAAADRRRGPMKIWIVVLLLVIGGAFIAYRDHHAKQEAHDQVCQVVAGLDIPNDDCP